MSNNKKCGFVALIGSPNAGKSTLLNCLVGSKLAIVTPKVQTTRDIIRGIAIEGDAQIIYLDTPGIFQTEQNFEKAMVKAAWNGARDSDAAILLIDSDKASRKGFTDEEKLLLESLVDMDKPKIVWLNKTDKVAKPALLKQVQEASELSGGAEIYMGSALKGHGIEELKDWISSHIPEGQWLFPEDQVSDLPMRFIAAEVTREKLMLRLRQELPYGLRVEPEQWQERADGSVKINQIVMVERDAHKKMVLGKNGQQLKEIGKSARHSLEKLLDRKVHLFLFVKVVPGWKDSKDYLPIGAE